MARKGLRGDVALALGGVRRVAHRGGVAQERAAGRRAGRGERADGARGLLDHEIDVGVAVPRQLHLEIADERLVDRGLERGRLVGAAVLPQFLDRGPREPRRPRGDLLLVRRPLVGEHARTGPAERGHVVGPGRERHADRERLAVRRVEPGHLAADADRLLERAEPGQVVGQRQQIGGAGREIGRREKGAFHVGLRPSRRLEGHGEGLVHPRLGMPGRDGGRDHLGCAVVAAVLAELGGRHPQPGQAQSEVAVVLPGSGSFCRGGRGLVGHRSRPEIAGDRRPEVL